MMMAEGNPGILFVLSAPSGTGKSTIARALVADLQELETFLHAHNISFAPILIDLSFTTQLFQFGQYTDEVYYEGAIDWINEVNSVIGQPDHLIFESWARPQYSDTNLISMITPINLPENDTSIFSHTRLINEGLDIFDCCMWLTGNVDGDQDDTVDLGDLTKLIDYLFISYEPTAVCP